MKNIKILFSIILTIIILFVSFNLFYKELISGNTNSIPISKIEYKVMSRNQLHEALSNETNYTHVEPTSSLSPFAISMETFDFESYILKISIPQYFSGSALVHIQGVFGSSFEIYDTSKELVYTHDNSKIPPHYYEFFSEVFLETNSKTLYLVIDVDHSSDRIGIFREPSVSNMDLITTSSFDFDETRHSIGFFLIILSLLLFIIGYFINDKEASHFILSISIFIACFGLWIFTDIYRHSKWIRTNLPLMSPNFVVLVFAISNNFLIPTFVKVNYFIIKNNTSKIIIDVFYKATLIFATLGMFIESVRLVVWNNTTDFLHGLIFDSFSFVMIIGSVVLLVLALYEMKTAELKSIIYGVGLSICIVSFTISQSTGILVSHWGVIALLITIALIFVIKFNEINENNPTIIYKNETIDTHPQQGKSKDLNNFDDSRSDTPTHFKAFDAYKDWISNESHEDK